ncbi:MAG: hypothetical protein WCB18_02080 [Thermoplasmata archaeon]
MGIGTADLGAIPILQLAPRRLHLGPFGSGMDLAKFLCVATIGAVVAAVSSAVVWLPFLGAGAIVAFVRVEGRSLDQYAVGYCRFRWRTSVGWNRAPSIPRGGPPRVRGEGHGNLSVRAGGIPIAYLPPADLQRLFEEWRSTLAAFDRPIGLRMRGERFSPLPFLPRFGSSTVGENVALASYCELVRALLRQRYRRVVDLMIWEDPLERHPTKLGIESDVSELVTALERLGIPVTRATRNLRDGGLVRGEVS